jgi:GNAT superfamily N-acetyltransferase
MTIEIRRARADEGARLKEIAVAAKSHWGYERESVERWADQGDFSPQHLDDMNAFVAEAGAGVVGWCSVVPKGDTWWLEDLWVEPAWIGKGRESARASSATPRRSHARMGARLLEWEAEPNALGFYERMGACYVRDSEPSAWGRIIPVMGIDLGD